jgi:hypothetical protein
MSSNSFLIDVNWDELGIDPNAEVGMDSSAYVPTSQFPPPPPIGNYDYAGITEGYTFGRDTAGNLYVRGNAMIVGGEYDNRRVSLFVSNRAAAYRPDGTDMEDFVRSAGIIPANGKRFTALELVNAIKETWTKVRRGYLTWEGYCSDCKKTIARGKTGAKKPDKEGFQVIGFQRGDSLIGSVVCPKCGKIVQAQGRIQKFYVN